MPGLTGRLLTRRIFNVLVCRCTEETDRYAAAACRRSIMLYSCVRGSLRLYMSSCHWVVFFFSFVHIHARVPYTASKSTPNFGWTMYYDTHLTVWTVCWRCSCPWRLYMLSIVLSFRGASLPPRPGHHSAWKVSPVNRESQGCKNLLYRKPGGAWGNTIGQYWEVCTDRQVYILYRVRRQQLAGWGLKLCLYQSVNQCVGASANRV